MKKKKSRKPIKFNQLAQEIYIANPGMIGQWCCKCKTRHIWILRIVRGDKKQEDFIEAIIFPDEIGTKLRRYYDQEEKVKNYGKAR